MLQTDVVVIGAGQCGLAMSAELARAGVEHVVLEQGASAGHRWATERWDSLRLLTPNRMNHLAGARYAGTDPDGYMTAQAFASQFDRAVTTLAPPLRTDTEVRSLTGAPGSYLMDTSRGPVAARAVVMANGACTRALVPGFACDMPGSVQQETAQTYKRPALLDAGPVLVVGASASGQQIARELALAGREVTLAVGTHVRMPRDYRGQDIVTWLDTLGRFDTPYTDVDDLERVRRTPSLSVIGTPERETLDLNALQAMGVQITGRLVAIRDGAVLFSGGMGALISAADMKLWRLRSEIDAWIADGGLRSVFPEPEPFVETRLQRAPVLTKPLRAFAAVVWATGYGPDFSWLHLPVFDRKGRLQHDGGRVASGLFAMGLPYLRTRRSSHIDGALIDAKAHLPAILASLSARQAA